MIEAYTDVVAVPATRTFDDRIVLPDRDMPLEIRFLGRGNTDGDAIVWAPRQRVVASGDLVVAPVPYAAHTHPGDWIRTLRALEALPWRQLVPGHGPLQRDRSYVHALIATLEEVVDHVAAAAKAGRTLDAIRSDPAWGAVRDRYTSSDGWLSFLVDAVFLRDLLSTAYKEVRGETVVQGVG